MPPSSIVTVSVDNDRLSVGQTATVTFTFSDTPFGFTASDVDVAGGSLQALTNMGNGLYQATFVPVVTDDLDASISVREGSYTDGFGQSGSGSNVVSITGDTQAPTVLSILPQDDVVTNADELVFIVKFSENIQADNFLGLLSAYSSFVVTGTSTATVSGFGTSSSDPDSLFVYVSGGDLASFNGSVGLATTELLEILDGMGNALVDPTPTGTVQSYTVDNTAPTASLSVDDGTYAVGDTITFTVTYSEDVSVHAPDDLKLAFTLAGAARHATHDGIASTDTTLVFRYVVTTDDVDAEGIQITGLVLGTGYVRDAAGNNANHTALATTDTSGVVVDVNLPPVVSSAITYNANEGDAAQGIDLLENASDPDAGAILSIRDGSLTFTVNGQATANGGTTLPAGVSLDGSTLTFDASADYDYLPQGGKSVITASFLIEDEFGASVAQTATITVTGKNDAPVVSQAITIGLDEDDAEQAIDLLQYASDVDQNAYLFIADLAFTIDGESTSYTSHHLPPGFTDLNNGALTIDPSHKAFQSLNQGESIEIVASYTVQDQALAGVSQTATITITGVNDAPTVSQALTFDSKQGEAARTIDLLEYASDVDKGAALNVKADSLTFTVNGQATGGNGSDLPAGVRFDGDTFTFDASEDFAYLPQKGKGVITASYLIEDEHGATVEQTATFTVVGVNDAPTVSKAITVNLHEDDAEQDIDLLAYASDVDQNAYLQIADLAFTINGKSTAFTDESLPPGFTDFNHGALTIDPSHKAFQSLNLGESIEIVATYTVQDEFFVGVNQTATITVHGVNDAPTIAQAITSQAGEGDAAYSLDLLAHAADIDNNAVLSVSAGSLRFAIDGVATVNDGQTVPDGVSISDGLLFIDPTHASFDGLALDATRVITVRFDIHDEHGATVSQTATITLTGTNDAPTVHSSSSAVQTVTVGTRVSLPTLTVSDVDSDSLTVTVTAVNGTVSGLTDLDTLTAGIQLTGTAAEINAQLALARFTGTSAGTASVTIDVRDEHEATSQLVHTIRVDPVPIPPVQPTVPPPVDQWGSLPDNDGDGVPEVVENLVPGMTGGVRGDGNGDGIPDVLQTDVSSLPWAQSPDGNVRFVTLVNDSGLAFSAVRPITVDPQTLPSNLSLPVGLVGFETTGVAVGATVQYTVYLDSDIPVNGYWKLVDGQWTNMATRIDEVGGKTRITFEVTDGGAFDADGEANGRIVDPGGPGWMDAAGDDTDGDQFPDSLEAANGLVVGVKDNDVFSSDKLFVMQVYRDFLHREAETEGLLYWQAQLEEGTLSRTDFIGEVQSLAEYQDGTLAVARLYLAALDRLPDGDGLAHWVQQAQSGQTLSEIAHAFAQSEEFVTAYGELGNAAFVDQLYQNVLNREADAGGKAYWLGELAAGATRGDILVNLAESAEFVANSGPVLTLTLNYLGMLGRIADADGLAYWMAHLGDGGSAEVLVGSILPTEEYHDRFLPAQASEVTLAGGADAGATLLDLG